MSALSGYCRNGLRTSARIHKRNTHLRPYRHALVPRSSPPSHRDPHATSPTGKQYLRILLDSKLNPTDHRRFRHTTPPPIRSRTQRSYLASYELSLAVWQHRRSSELPLILQTPSSEFHSAYEVREVPTAIAPPTATASPNVSKSSPLQPRAPPAPPAHPSSRAIVAPRTPSTRALTRIRRDPICQKRVARLEPTQRPDRPLRPAQNAS